MNITVNGSPEQVPDGISLERAADARAGQDARRKGIAIARNGEVVPRGRNGPSARLPKATASSC